MRALALTTFCLLGSSTILAQTYGVSVTPDGGTEPNRLIQTTGWTKVFTVQNTGTAFQMFTMTCSGAGSVTCTGVSPTSIGLTGGAQTTVTATYDAGNEGTGTLTVKAAGLQSTDQGFVTVPVVLPAGAPRMSVLPWLEAKQDFGRCAAACFAATWAQGTVPYFALDAGWNVTLAYHGDRVQPRPFVAVDVFPDTTFGSWPSEYQLQVKVGGNLMTFVNGDQTLRFTGTTGSTRYRLAGQFAPSPIAQDTVYSMEIIVTAKIAAASYTNRWVTQYLHIDESKSRIARGWTVGGVQRMFSQADGSRLILEGDGSAVYFKWNTATLTWDVPAGEFSKLVTGQQRVYPDSTKVNFDVSGYMTTVVDRFGNTTTVTYDASHRISQIKDPLNNAITLAYGATGLATITDPVSRVTTVSVATDSTLSWIQDPDNLKTSFGYDASRRLLTITARNNKTTTLGYDAQSGKVATITAPAIPVYTGGTSSPVTTLAAWQKVGVPYSSTAVTPFNPVRADTVYGRVTEPGGSAVTKFTVNRWGSPAALTNALNEVTTTTYSTNGQPVKIVAPGYGTAFDTLTYNSSGLVTYSRAASSTATTVLYGAWGQPTDVFGSGQDSTHYFVGVNGRVDSVRVGGQTVQKVTSWDSFGRPLTVIDGQAVTIMQYFYKATGTNRQLDSLRIPGGRKTSYAYDTYGRLITTTPPAGSLPRFLRYDVLNRVLADSVPTSGTPTVTRYTYDSLFVKQVTDPKNQSYGYTYNALGWLTVSTDPAGGKDSLFYAVNGDLMKRKNRRNQTINFGYDALHRLTSRSGTSSVSWSFTNNGYTVAATSPISTETTYLNIKGSPDSIKTLLAGQTYWRRSGYTAYGLLDTVTVTGPGGVTFRGRKYLYNDAKGILTTIRLGGRTTSIGVDGNFNPTGITFPGGDLRSFTQGTLQTPIKVTTTAAYNFAIERWLGINMLGQIDRHQTYPNAKFGRWFAYDSLGRLRVGTNVQRTPENLPGGCPTLDFGLSGSCTPVPDYQVLGADTVSYDAVGNRTDKGGTYATGNRITAFNACAYTTDADGNVTGRSGGSCTGAASFFWTAEGFLDSLQAGATGVKFLYDADGRLVLKRVNGVAGAYFLWDGAQLLAELNGTATSKVAEYSYYPGLDQLHALVVGSAAYYAHVDGVGNVVALTDTAQAAKRTYAYGDWGTLTGGTDGLPFSGADRARWKGALWLGPEVELYYLRNRWYEPATGRFLSEDPVGLAGGVNPVIFAGANPISGFDPTGLLRIAEDPPSLFPWPFAIGPSIVPPGSMSRPGTQGELLRYGGGGGTNRRLGKRPTQLSSSCPLAFVQAGAALVMDAFTVGVLIDPLGALAEASIEGTLAFASRSAADMMEWWASKGFQRHAMTNLSMAAAAEAARRGGQTATVVAKSLAKVGGAIGLSEAAKITMDTPFTGIVSLIPFVGNKSVYAAAWGCVW